MSTEQSRPLQAVIGARLRDHRSALKMRQEDVADLARRYGLEWVRTTVAAVERGARRVGLEELVLLSMAFQVPLRFWVGWDDLAADDEPVALTSHAVGSRRGVESLLAGADPSKAREHEWEGLDEKSWEVPESDQHRSYRRNIEALKTEAKSIFPELEGKALMRVLGASVSDTERRAAASLDTTSVKVAAAAMKAWGRSLAEEREARLEAEHLMPAPARTIQAMRGHFSRVLIEELRPIINERKA